MANITKTAEKYISEHPHIKNCISAGVVNYSSLSRKIINESQLKQDDFDAVLIASRRYAEKIRKKNSDIKSISNVLKSSKLEIKNRRIAVVLEKSVHYKSIRMLEDEIKKFNEIIHIIESPSAVTLITADEFLPTIKKMFPSHIIKINKDCVEVILKSSIDMETIPGVISHLYSLFGDYGINIIETMSCYTDTIILINEADLKKTIDILKF